MESQRSQSTQVIFVTPGVLLRKLINDPDILEYSHVIIDEAHERDRNTEFLLIILRDICARRSALKLILMSATMHTYKISTYFNNCPHISMGGSNFPVKEYYLEHVLHFTGYLNDQMMNKRNNEGVIANSAMSYYNQCSQVYQCAICGTGPFKSSEELGAHSAMCFYTASVTNGNGNKSSNRGSMSSLNDLVRRLTVAAGAPEPMPTIVSAFAIDDDGNEDDDDYDDADDDADAIDTYSPTEDDANIGTSMEVLVDTPEIEVTTAFDDLLREYQISFDDEQVDYDLIISLLKYVFYSSSSSDIIVNGYGSVLVFLPGWDDISKLYRMLLGTTEFSRPGEALFYTYAYSI